MRTVEFSYTQQDVNLGFSLCELCAALGVILSHTKFAKNAEKNFHYLNIEALFSIEAKRQRVVVDIHGFGDCPADDRDFFRLRGRL